MQALELRGPSFRRALSSHREAQSDTQDQDHECLLEHQTSRSSKRSQELPISLHVGDYPDPIELQRSLSRCSSLGSHHTGHCNWLTGTGYLFTIILGAGILALPEAVSWLGWLLGPVCLVLFYALTLWTGSMLAAVYQVGNTRHTRYKFAVQTLLGPRHAQALAIIQSANLVLVGIGYQIAAAESMSFVDRQVCALQSHASCPSRQWQMMLFFGAAQLLLSQLPDLESAAWASLLAATCSLGYSGIALCLGLAGAHHMGGSLSGRPAASPAAKAFGVFTSLGTLAFSYGCTTILLEVQDTLREPPKAVVSMRKALLLALSVTFLLYTGVGVAGYLALGDEVPGSIVLGFSSTAPVAAAAANLLVVLHLVPAWQVFSQPLFATIEDLLLVWLPVVDTTPEWITRAVYRSLYVVLITLVALWLPFFAAFTGLIGAIAFWPLGVYYPITMYRKVYCPQGPLLWLMRVVVVGMGLVSALAVLSALESIVRDAAGYGPPQFH